MVRWLLQPLHTYLRASSVDISRSHYLIILDLFLFYGKCSLALNETTLLGFYNFNGMGGGGEVGRWGCWRPHNLQEAGDLDLYIIWNKKIPFCVVLAFLNKHQQKRLINFSFFSFMVCFRIRAAHQSRTVCTLIEP